MRPFRFFSIFLFLSVAACVDPFKTDIAGTRSLVVDALITDKPGPHAINLSYSAKPGFNEYTTEKMKGAQVTITDDTGAIETLTESGNGKYLTSSSFKALPGRVYTLKIKSGGLIYASDPEAFQDPGQLDNLYAEFVENATGNRFDIYVDATRKPGSPGLMLWRWNATFKYQTFPNLYVSEGKIAPRPCSGFLSNPHTPCLCCLCWATERSFQPVIYDGEHSVGDKYERILAGVFLVLADRFEEKSYIEMQQYSLSPAIYNFWKLMIIQQSGASSLFQPASVKVKGNVHSETNPNEEVLGIFGVSGMVSKSIFINRKAIPKNLQPLQEFKNDDCRIFYPNTTTTAPSFWF